ncbi:MAG TPA: hypothetical protein VFP39_17125 [Gemmatimonadales bacterium]|nr:hypothetical protein [Gemmatimonadales bacterium]
MVPPAGRSLLLALLCTAAPPLAGQVVTRADLERLRATAVRVPVILQAGKPTADTLRPDVTSLRLGPTQVLVAELRDTSHRFLPFLFLAADPHANQPLALRPYVESTALEYTGTTFRGSVALGLVDTLQPARTATLPVPIWFHLSAEAGEVNPADVPIRHTSLPPSRAVVTAATPGDSLRVLIQPALTLTPITTWLAAHRTLLALEPATARIAGFGLGRTELHVTLVEGAGAARRDVVLSARRGTPDPSIVSLTGGETGRSTIRSSGVGRDTITATSGVLRAAPLELVYGWPLLFLAAALLGGVVGSVMDCEAIRRRGTPASRRAYVLSGLSAGLFAAVAIAIGLNVTGVDLPATSGEAVVFVAAALGTVLSLRGLRRALPGFGKLLEREAAPGS